MEQTNYVERPLIIELDDAKSELIQCVNKVMVTHKLPCYLIEPIMSELYNQIKIGAQNELTTAKAQIAKQNGAE